MEPALLGYYGVTKSQEYSKNGSLGMRYFRNHVEERIELSSGYIENKSPIVDDFGFGFVPYPINGDRNEFYYLLEWLYSNQKHAKDEDGNLLKDIVLCDSKFLETVINSAFEKPYIPQKYAAKKYQGIIFIKRIRTKTKLSSIRDHSGWKFCEKFTEEIEPADVETDCYSVHRLSVSGMNIFYSRRVHCFKEKTFDPNRNDIIFLATAPITYKTAHQNEFQSLSSRVWWSQCFLSNANEVYVGKRDEKYFGGGRKPSKIFYNGYDIHTIADLRNVGMGYWDPKEGFEELANRFDQIKLEVFQDDCDTIHEYIITSKDNITHECKIVGDVDDILSDDALSMLDELKQNIVHE